MNRILRKSILCMVLIIAFISISKVCYGASIGLSVGYKSITVGGSTTLTIKGNDAIGKVSITSSNPNIVSVSSSSAWIEPSSSVTLTTKSVGTATITVSAVDMADGAGNAFSGSNSITITVNPVYIDTRSKNNNLTNLSVVGHTLNQEFNKDMSDYSITVPHEIENVEITATLEDTAASYTVEGNTELKYGDNLITIYVSAENGDKKTYKIWLTREKNPDDTNTKLSSLMIENAIMRDTFDKEVYVYTCEDLSVEVEKLDISAIPEIAEAKVEIIGNESLKLGTNNIKVKVTSKDETAVQEYDIIVYKSAEMLSLKEINEEPPKFFSKDNWKQLLLFGIIIIEFIIIVLLLIKKSNKTANYTSRESKENELNNEKIKKDENEIMQNISLEDVHMTEDVLKFNDANKIKTRRHRNN